MIATQPQGPRLVTLAGSVIPARYVVLDIETGDPDEAAIQAAIDGWKAPSNWKPETVEKNRAEYAEKIRSKAALLDASPILCVGMRADTGAMMFSGMGDPGPLNLAGWGESHHDTERDMLVAMAAWLNLHTDPLTVLVGHNVRGFDLPKLRGAYVRHRIPLPNCLRPVESGPSQPVTDTMSLFKHFSMEHRDALFVGLDTVCRAFGVPRPKQIISGANVPRLHKEGQIAPIIIYNAIDVDATTEVYRLMMA